MTMTFRINVDLGNVLAAVPAAINQGVMPNLSAAVYRVADRVSYRWKESIQAAKLWDGERKAYMASVVIKPSGPFAAVVESEYKFAQDIETGRPAYDLKRMLQTSTKTRMSKDGRKYLIIPFRHNAPGARAMPSAMPTEIHAAAKQMSASRVTGMTTRTSATGHVVPQRIYQWGQKLDVPAGADGKRSKYDGMYRFDTSTGKQNRSTYLTFRVMTEGSSGWVIPPRPGLHLVRKVVAEMAPKAEQAFQKAMEADTRA